MARGEAARHTAILLLVSAVAFFWNLGTPRLWDRDEPRNAGCAAEMLARADWVVPVFNGQLRQQKPALLYWLMMAAYGLVGTNEWGARLPSALLSVGTALATYAIGRRLFGPRSGLFAGIALATSLMFVVAARAATPDATLIFFATLGAACFVYGVFPRDFARQSERRNDANGPIGQVEEWQSFSRPLPWPAAAAMYAALGLAMLAKGPVGVVLPLAAAGMFLLVARLPRPTAASEARGLAWLARGARQAARPFGPRNFLAACRQLRPGWALAVVALVALPWYSWVGVRTQGEWIEGFLWNDNVRRVLDSLEDHRGSPLFYPAAILFGFFPWSVFALPVTLEMWARLRGRERQGGAYLFCACWVGVYVGLFTLARTKLPSYVTPCYPALALLTGDFLRRYAAGELRVGAWWMQVALGVLALVGGAALVGLPLAARSAMPGLEWLGAVALIPLAGAAAALAFAWRGGRQAAVAAFSAAAVLFAAAFFGVALVQVDRQRQEGALFAEVARRSNEPRIASYGCLESSWVFYAGRPIDEFLLGGAPQPKKWPTPAEASAAREFAHIREFAAQPEAFIITTETQLPELLPQLAPEMRVLAKAPYFLEKETLVLLGRDGPIGPLARKGREAAPR